MRRPRDQEAARPHDETSPLMATSTRFLSPVCSPRSTGSLKQRTPVSSSSPVLDETGVRRTAHLSPRWNGERPTTLWQRITSRRILGLALSCALIAHLATPLHSRLTVSDKQETETCQPWAYDNGQWVKKANASSSIGDMADFYAASGFAGCVGVSENEWEFFGFGEHDFDRRVAPLSWRWEPHPKCRLRHQTIQQKLQTLVDGKIMLVGDSLERQQFFELSCELYGHVTWRGEPMEDAPTEEIRWHGATQHLMLDPASPLVSALTLPTDFDFAKPIVTYLCAALPLSLPEFRAMPGVNTSLIMTELVDPVAWAVYGYPMNRTHDHFVDPANGFKTMIFSTGAHFSRWSLFYRADNAEVMGIFRQSMSIWFDALSKRLTPGQRVLVRAAPPGHDNPAGHSRPEVEVPFTGDNWQWRMMPDMNNILRDEMLLAGSDQFTWIGGERIARLRPDAHLNAANDGMHYTTGSGIMEAWSRYMWHLVTQ